MLEAAFLDLGIAVARQVLAVKVKERIHADSIRDVLTRRGLSLLDTRKAVRQFDQMAELVAERLSSQLRHEMPSLPSYEIEAALLAVRDSFDAADFNYQEMLDDDLDASKLEARIREASKSVLSSAALSEPGGAYYNFVLRECTNYVIEIAIELPELGGRNFREVLQRETELKEMVQAILERMPAAEGEESSADPDLVFELQYRRQIARKLDELKLFGLTVTTEAKKYPLTVAYMSLNLDLQTQSEVEDQGDSDEASPGQSAEEVLASSPKLIVRGEAGSGKTTLLQWTAVSAARGTFDSEVFQKESWLPYFIQLRTYVDQKLPAPSEFLDQVAPVLADEMPHGWVSRSLANGNCMVLIDGLDELPLHRRDDVAEWLQELEDNFPLCRFVVTSRPSGISDDWVRGVGYAEAELLPMSPPDIGSFIEHWHHAAASVVDTDEERSELVDYESKLIRLVASVPSIQSLATSPLMCAMLCALHRDRRTQVPADRTELYRIALETLLDRRDAERKVGGELSLTLPQKLLLLQHIAFWFLMNDKSDAVVVDVVRQLEERLPSMQRVSASAEDVYRHLLERSGLLREPVAGRVDFLHRTFQEYLGAREAVARNNIGFLVDKALDDQWREVIVLACGHATPAQARELIGSLLTNGWESEEHRHILHLMAVACLETTVDLDDDLVKMIGTAVEGLVPPGSMTEAKLLASAGEVAVGQLGGFRRRKVQVVAATVRALTLIGTSSALEALKEYASDPRLGVYKELVRGWVAFDPDVYASEILAKSPVLKSGFETSDPVMAKAANVFPDDIPVRCRVRALGPSLDAFSGARQVETLNMIGNASLRVLDAIKTMPRLKRLDLERCESVNDFSPLSECTALEWLDLSGTRVGPDLSLLSELRQLSWLGLWPALSLHSLTGLEAAAGLKSLSLAGLDGSTSDSWDALTSLEALTSLTISSNSFPGLQVVGNPKVLRSLTIAAPSNVDRRLGDFSELQDLHLYMGAPHDTAFEALGEMVKLLDVSISAANRTEFSWVPPRVRELAVSGYAGQDLSGMPQDLRSLSITEAPNLTDISALAEMPHLYRVTLRGCPKLEDFRPLQSLPRYGQLYLDHASRQAASRSLGSDRRVRFLRVDPAALSLR